MFSKRFSRSGESRRSEASVGCRSSSTGSRSRISGSVLTANVRTRASVAFVSARNVGRIRIESASASRRSASSPKSSVLRCTNVASALLVGGELLERAPGVLDEVAQRRAAVVEHARRRPRAPSANAGRLPSASLRSRPRPAPAFAALACHCRNALRVGLVEDREQLVELDRRTDLAVGQARALLHVARAAAARRRPRRTSRRAASSGAGSRARRPSSARTSSRARSS